MILKLFIIIVVVGLAAYGFVSFQEDIEQETIITPDGPMSYGKVLMTLKPLTCPILKNSNECSVEGEVNG